jgi:hypothetical protein
VQGSTKQIRWLARKSSNTKEKLGMHNKQYKDWLLLQVAFTVNVTSCP